MGRFLIVSKADGLAEYQHISKQYDAAFELNDFYDPDVLDDEAEKNRIMEAYRSAGMPAHSTMHGAFYDVVVFSRDKKIRQISVERMRQSMDIAKNLGLCGVVFHTNYNPSLCSPQYDGGVIDKTVECLELLLNTYPDINIYLENMFDATPDILAGISERLKKYGNFGVCLDYAHATISPTPVQVWVERLLGFVKHIHINDNDLARDLHLPLGRGSIDWNQFFDFYKRYFSDCSVLVETTLPEDQRVSLEYLKREGMICQNTVF
jgi:sugar phosphate isomerase/epimerase